MPAKIGLISDVHATVGPLRQALALFQREQVDMIFCAGDIAGYGDELDGTIELLTASQCRSIVGNHDIWYRETQARNDKPEITAFLSALPVFLDLTLAGKRLYVVHAHPPDANSGGIKLLDENGNIIPARKQQWSQYLAEFDHDVLIVGHTHQVFIETLGDTLAINPGSTKFNHTCMILTLPEMSVQTIPLSNKTPLKVWNWGRIVQMNPE